MKRNMKKIVSLLLVLMFAVVGCSSGGTEKNSTTTASSQDSTSDSTVAESKEVKLNLFIPQPRFRDQYEAYINQFVTEYEAKTGVHITYDLEMPSADTADEILKTRLTTGENLDVFMIHAINEKAQYYKAGYLEDLSNESWVSGLYDSAKEAVTTDGKVVALPLESLTWGMLYNKALFTELGLKPALTLDEMSSNITAIEAAGKTAFLASYNEQWIPQLFLPLIVGGLVNSTETSFVSDMNSNATSFANLPGFFDIIDLVQGHINANGLEIGGSDGCAEFASGNYGMWVQGPWFSATILEANPDFEIGVAPLPISNDPSQAMINASVSTSLAVSSFSENKEVSKALVAYFLNPNTTNDFFTSVQFNPLSSVHTFSSYPWIEEAAVYVGEGKAYVDPSIPQAVKDESGKMLQAYYSNSATKEDVFSALDEAWKTFNEINGN